MFRKKGKMHILGISCWHPLCWKSTPISVLLTLHNFHSCAVSGVACSPIPGVDCNSDWPIRLLPPPTHAAWIRDKHLI